MIKSKGKRLITSAKTCVVVCMADCLVYNYFELSQIIQIVLNKDSQS
jgi:hypothetical protein